ncbi:type II restriction endonuclease [Marinobacter sp. F4216]|uniref:type II restriction endonuclease n=1 Tax=Marinobacter sp. F4216 TaxID=2874281 RepID=UPI001CC03A00|nr:type II restriction endonuclease [Marinobacter sp. F4216]MBZ2168292.1 DNA mismatch endonuclease Vsr [Marinobacter sp. F4216]
MADVHNSKTRSRNMAAIKGKNTKPEVWLRKKLFKRGFRFRLHRKDLPGKPDIVLPKYGAVILVQGCFWHGHYNCPMFRIPSSRTEFWEDKISSNRKRDSRNIDELLKLGWRVLEVWECSLKGKLRLSEETLLGSVCAWITGSEAKAEIRGICNSAKSSLKLPITGSSSRMSDFGSISDYLSGAAVKRLTAVECDPTRSNGHEINATSMKSFMGTEARSDIPTTFVRLDDDEEKIESVRGTCSWWFRDRTTLGKGIEYRLYYQDNPAISEAEISDALAIALKPNDELIFVTAPQGSQSELELFELFGPDFGNRFKSLDFTNNDEKIGPVKRFILEELGIEVKASFGLNYLSTIESHFGPLTFPATRQFSQLARKLGGELEEFDSADNALVAWWETEEAMFRQLEGAIIEERLVKGFADAEDFLSFSQSIRQRRSSRAGSALENHLEQIFLERNIRFSREKKTEKNKKPDFLFPSVEDYRNNDFPTERLTMLGVKTTCKDRWRQVLSEAGRIECKHLFTLQPKISSNQTDEMIDSKLQLVVPRSIHDTYSEAQKSWLWDLEQFLEKIKKNEASD